MKVFILFGEMGCGKTYIGKRLAIQTKSRFWDGDEAITPEMLERVSQFKPLTLDIIERYVAVLGDSIVQIAKESDTNLIVSQALYLDKHRKNLASKIENFGCEIEFCWVKCGNISNIMHLWSRPQKMQWIWYWLINKPFFQKPSHPHQILFNY